MTDIEKALGPSAERKGGLPKGWLILTGILILLNLITLGVGKYKDGRAIEQLKDTKAKYTATLRKERKAHIATLNTVIEEKGRAVATALKVTDPLVLNARNPLRANELVQHLLKDPYIAYVVLRDEDGGIVTQGSQLSREDLIPKMTDVTVSKAETFSADLDVQGPIEDSHGRQIGMVRIGLTRQPAQGKYVETKPSGEDSLAHPELAP